MAEAARAVGSAGRREVERAINPTHNDILNALDDLAIKVDDMATTIGKPGTADGGQPASGIFAHLNAHDRRIKKFEVLWHQAVGFGLAAIPLLCALWWLAGDRISHILRG